ncbi:hypothetical protein [Novosphingobium sp.]|uniref:hypothetical protein n=1 Tax=Novosphingobium sp. TaxID=1874826 RepID=UPI0031D8D0C5
MLPLLMALALMADGPTKAPVHDNGVCTGISWITLAPGESATVDTGADFEVMRFSGPLGPEDNWWSVYNGDHPQVTGNGPVLLERDGVTVRSALTNGLFRGYVAQKGDGALNHFFGSIFTGTPTDKAIFDRIDFGRKRDLLCGKDKGGEHPADK